jgi:hypothetical protein
MDAAKEEILRRILDRPECLDARTGSEAAVVNLPAQIGQ